MSINPHIIKYPTFVKAIIEYSQDIGIKDKLIKRFINSLENDDYLSALKELKKIEKRGQSKRSAKFVFFSKGGNDFVKFYNFLSQLSNQLTKEKNKKFKDEILSELHQTYHDKHSNSSNSNIDISSTDLYHYARILRVSLYISEVFYEFVKAVDNNLDNLNEGPHFKKGHDEFFDKLKLYYSSGYLPDRLQAEHRESFSLHFYDYFSEIEKECKNYIYYDFGDSKGEIVFLEPLDITVKNKELSMHFINFYHEHKMKYMSDLKQFYFKQLLKDAFKHLLLPSVDDSKILDTLPSIQDIETHIVAPITYISSYDNDPAEKEHRNYKV